MNALKPAVLALGLALGCQSAPEVRVVTAVGDARDRGRISEGEPNPITQAVELWNLTTGRLHIPAREQGRVPSRLGPVVHPPTTPAEFHQLVAAMDRLPADEVAGPAQRLAATPTLLWPQVRDALLAPRTASPRDYRAVLGLIGGDVPNHYGHFDLAWKLAHGYQVHRSENWFDDLLGLSPGRVSSALSGVFRDTLRYVSLLQAAAQIGRQQGQGAAVTETLLQAARLHTNVFRDEVSRALTSIGEQAIVPLFAAALRASPDDTWEAAGPYAKGLLDRMDRWLPERAEAALAHDPEELAKLFEVWGAAKYGEAAAILLSHSDSPVPRLRTRARTAFRALVEGPAPAPLRRSVRLLGGGLGHAAARLTYRDQARVALDELTAMPSAPLPPCPPPVRSSRTVAGACVGLEAAVTALYFGWLDATRAEAARTVVAQARASDDRGQALALLDRLWLQTGEAPTDPAVADLYRAAATAALEADEPALAARHSRKAAVVLGEQDRTVAAALTQQAREAEQSVVARADINAPAAAGTQSKPGHLLARWRGQGLTHTHLWILGMFAVGLAFACLAWLASARASERVPPEAN